MVKVMETLHITEKQFWNEMSPYSVKRILWWLDLQADIQDAQNKSVSQPSVQSSRAQLAQARAQARVH
jgi:hypothetical protein